MPLFFFSFILISAGNFMYFMGFSKWLLLSSRLVAGEFRILRMVPGFKCKRTNQTSVSTHDHPIRTVALLTALPVSCAT